MTSCNRSGRPHPQSNPTARVTSDNGRPAFSIELDLADKRVAQARQRVEQMSKVVEDEMRHGDPAGERRELLATCQRVLRDAVAFRELVHARWRDRSSILEPSSVEPDEADKAPGTTAAERGG